MKNKIRLLIVATVIFGWSTQVYAWSGKTHSALTEKAISDNNQSILDEYLKNRLGIDQGLNCVLLLDDNTAVYDLLREEDGDTYGYPVTFVRDEMGQWKISDF